MLKMNFTIVTFLVLQSPSSGTLDKNTRYGSYMSSETENHHLLGCLLHSTELNARCTNIWIMLWPVQGDESWANVFGNYLCTSFGLLLVHSQPDMCIHRNRKC